MMMGLYGRKKNEINFAIVLRLSVFMMLLMCLYSCDKVVCKLHVNYVSGDLLIDNDEVIIEEVELIDADNSNRKLKVELCKDCEGQNRINLQYIDEPYVLSGDTSLIFQRSRVWYTVICSKEGYNDEIYFHFMNEKTDSVATYENIP